MKKVAKQTDLQGFKSYKNKNNGFAVFELHYTADPKKRSKEWKRQASSGMSKQQWDTEMELSWETYSGEAVYGKEFNRELHIMKKQMLPESDIPIFRGWDFGGNQSCVMCQFIDGCLYVLDELPNAGHNTRQFAPQVMHFCNEHYGVEFHYIDVIDPSAMWEGKTAGGLACADIMRELGLTPVPGLQSPDKRIDAVMKLLVTMRNGHPCLQINPNCAMLISGFLGGYHYPEKLIKNRKMDRPEKNEFSHVADALQYVATRLDYVQQNRNCAILASDTPTFRWGSR